MENAYEENFEEFKELKLKVTEKTKEYKLGVRLLDRPDLSSEEVESIHIDLEGLDAEIAQMSERLDGLALILREQLKFVKE